MATKQTKIQKQGMLGEQKIIHCNLESGLGTERGPLFQCVNIS